jgi:hypothetical protein
LAPSEFSHWVSHANRAPNTGSQKIKTAAVFRFEQENKDIPMSSVRLILADVFQGASEFWTVPGGMNLAVNSLPPCWLNPDAVMAVAGPMD